MNKLIVVLLVIIICILAPIIPMVLVGGSVLYAKEVLAVGGMIAVSLIAKRIHQEKEKK